ncbi:MAG TPA: glycosyltransferase, partial [Methylomirabilota bacterium]|nr:glycosyltransferase [Methylomirabilota bacterium]
MVEFNPIVTGVPSTTPLVSVAMITHNHRPYIEKAVASILAQEADFGVELVIGEDHSEDGTREWVLELGRREPNRVRVITSERNVGLHANLLRVERACRGRYIAYCEGDDFWQDPRKLAKQVAFLEARPDYTLVHSHCDRFVVSEQRLLRDSLVTPPGLDDGQGYRDIMLGVRNPLTVTVVARREALMRVLEHCPECSDPRWPMGDTQRWLELSRLGRVGCLHESLATTNLLPESAGQSRDPAKRLRFYLAARELKLHYLKKYPLPAEEDVLVRGKLALILLQHAHDARDAAVAEAMYREYVAVRGRPGWRARWLRWSSRSPVLRRVLTPVLWSEAQ